MLSVLQAIFSVPAMATVLTVVISVEVYDRNSDVLASIQRLLSARWYRGKPRALSDKGAAAFLEFRINNFQLSASWFSTITYTLLVVFIFEIVATWRYATGLMPGNSFESKAGLMWMFISMHFIFRAVATGRVKTTETTLNIFLVLVHMVPIFDCLQCAHDSSDFFVNHGFRNICRCVFGLMFLSAHKVSFMNFLITGAQIYTGVSNVRAFEDQSASSLCQFILAECLSLVGVVLLLAVVEGWLKERTEALLDSHHIQVSARKLLSVTCDADVRLSPDMHIIDGTQLQHLLKCFEELEGKLFTDYLSEFDRVRFDDFISESQTTDDMQGTSLPPSCLHVHLVDSLGTMFNAVLFHIGVSSRFCSGESDHLIGIKHDVDDSYIPEQLIKPEAFSVSITSSDERPIGMAVSTARGELVVRDIMEGLVSDWNSTASEHQVQVGCRLIEVNCKTTMHDMIEELRAPRLKAKPLQITFMPASALCDTVSKNSDTEVTSSEPPQSNSTARQSESFFKELSLSDVCSLYSFSSESERSGHEAWYEASWLKDVSALVEVHDPAGFVREVTLTFAATTLEEQQQSSQQPPQSQRPALSQWVANTSWDEFRVWMNCRLAIMRLFRDGGPHIMEGVALQLPGFAPCGSAVAELKTVQESGGETLARFNFTCLGKDQALQQQAVDHQENRIGVLDPIREVEETIDNEEVEDKEHTKPI